MKTTQSIKPAVSTPGFVPPNQRRGRRWLWQSLTLCSVLVLAACGGGSGGSTASTASTSNTALAAQISDLTPTDTSTTVSVFVELGSSTVAGAADVSVDAATQRAQLQTQFLKDLQAAATLPAQGASTSTCSATDLAARIGNAYSPVSGSAVRVELNACEMTLLSGLNNVKGVYQDVPLAHNAAADAVALATEVTRAFDGGTTAWPSINNNPTSNGNGTVIAVIDSGVEERHPALGSGKVLQGACFSTAISSSTSFCVSGSSDTSSSTAGRSCADHASWNGSRSSAISAGCYHGTSMAAVAAMDYSGTSGNAAHGGVAKAATILPVQVFSKLTSGGIGSTSSDVLAAVEWVTAMAKLRKASGLTPIVAVNMSLGSGAYSAACDSNYVGGLYKTAFTNLRAQGVIPIVAAGNDGNASAVSFPACVSNAVTVAASKLNYTGRASYSNFSGQVKVFAPGGDVDGTGKYLTPALCAAAGSYDCWTSMVGTSPATAFVSGAVAALYSTKPTATVSDIEAALTTDLSSVYPSYAKSLTFNAVTRPALRVTASAYKLLGLGDPGTASSSSGSSSAGSSSSSTTTDVYAWVCFYEQANFLGGRACALWNEASTNAGNYAYGGRVNSVKMIPLDATQTQTAIKVTLYPWSSRSNVSLTLDPSSATQGVAQVTGLPSNALVRALTLAN